MGYVSGFVSLGCGAILKLVHDGLREAPVGVDWESHRGQIRLGMLRVGQDLSSSVPRDLGEGHLGQRTV